jgi:putative two-component system response regulator
MKSVFNPNARILVVDDEPFNLQIVAETLNEAGFTNVVTEGNPKEALKLFVKTDFDLLLLDLLMPEFSGKDFVNFVESKFPGNSVPIVILTAVSDKKVIQYMLSKGNVVDYLTKPFEAAELLARVKNILAARTTHIQLERLVLEKTEESRQAHSAIIQALARAAEFKDNETGAHIKRIGLISQTIALALGWSEDKANMIHLTSPLHDLGKVGIPEEVLLKTGPLSHDEKKLMEKHTILGAVLLMESGMGENELVQMATNIALNHHEKWDGQGGYPRGLARDKIPIEARIVAVADVYDALLSKRPYKEAWKPDRALEYVRENSGKQFDPSVAEVFLNNADKINAIRDKNIDEFTSYMVRAKRFENQLLSLDASGIP